MGISRGGYIGVFALVALKGSTAVTYSFSIQAIQWIITGIDLTLLAFYGIMNSLAERIRGRTEPPTSLRAREKVAREGQNTLLPLTPLHVPLSVTGLN